MKKGNNIMKIVSSLNPAQPLTDLSAWRDAFVAIDKNQGHWKEGRSACSLARYFLSGRGVPEIGAALNGLLAALRTKTPSIKFYGLTNS